MESSQSARKLLRRLTLYFVAMVGSLVTLSLVWPGVVHYLPIGGTDAIEMAQLEYEIVSSVTRAGQEITESRLSPSTDRTQRALVMLFLVESLILALLIMLPITWTYTTTRGEFGGHRSFIRALLVLPICATTVVLLIQGSLALAFGLAAMVAAVRFRVRLKEPIDGIYIFAAICVGLAGGIGHMGVALVMAVFFCFANVIIWMRSGESELASSPDTGQ